MKRILLVCTGNTCRSPMAEAMLRDMARQAGRTLEVRSAGIAAMDGMPPSANAVETLNRRRIPLPGSSAALTSGTVEWADVILTMTTGHKQAIAQRHPGAIDKTFTLKEFALSGTLQLEHLAEAEKLYGELKLRQALGESPSPEELERLLELQRKLPSFDIADPFGGPLSSYEQAADEIEAALRAALDQFGHEQDEHPRGENSGENTD